MTKNENISISQALRYSVGVHALLFVLLLFYSAKSEIDLGSVDNKNGTFDVQIVENNTSAPHPAPELKQSPNSENVVATIIPPGGSGDRKCKNYYGGIGVMGRATGEDQIFITDVIDGYPGSSIGLIPGDLVFTADGSPLLGEPGTKMNLIIFRQGIKTTRMVTREAICAE